MSLFCEKQIQRGFYWVLVLILFPASHSYARQDSDELNSKPVVAERVQASEGIEKPAGQPVAGQSQVPAEMVNEINRIRSQMGSGVAERLQGIFPQEDDAGSTAHQLQREFDQKLNALVHQDNSGSNESVEKAPAKIRPQNAVFQNETGTENQASRIRAAARNLELAAAELEIAKMYEMADRVRGQAKILWRKARNEDPVRQTE